MKHKPSSLTTPKISSIFSPKSDEDKIAAILRPLPPSPEPLKLILFSHLDLLLIQLSHKALPETSFILQRFSPSLCYYMFTSKFSLPNIQTSAQPMRNKYLISGKYVNIEISAEHPEPTSAPLQPISQELVRYLCKFHGNIVSCELEWFQDETGSFYLVDICKVTEGVILAGQRIIRSVSKSMPISKPSSRPITARSNNKGFRFSPSSLCGEADSKRLVHGNYTTPRCFKLSYEFPCRGTQTSEASCCEKKGALEMCRAELEKAADRKKRLEKELEAVRLKNNRSIREINEFWGNKCVEISNIMAEKMHAQRKKFETKIKTLKKHEKMIS